MEDPSESTSQAEFFKFSFKRNLILGEFSLGYVFDL